MPQFAFFSVPRDGAASFSVVDAPSRDDAKRQARASIDREDLDAIRIWDGHKTVEVRRPRMRPAGGPTPADDRGARMATMRADGMTKRAIGEAAGVSKDRVSQIIARTERRARMRDVEPNRAALTVRAQNLLPLIIVEPETDPAERDAKLPGRVAALTRREISRTPNAGKRTVDELEAWLWERGLSFDE